MITGGARGIGLAIGRELGRRGAAVVLTDVLEAELRQAEEALRSGGEGEGVGVETGVDVLVQRADVTVQADCDAAVAAALQRHGRLDILVNNAGISIISEFADCAPDTCARLFDVNLMGAVRMTHAALPALRESRGHLLFVSSVSGIRAIPTGAAYSASKAALRSLAESLRLELRRDGVHVGVVSPGFTPTEASKTVLRGDGTTRPVDRPAHDTPEGVARQTAALIARRQRERVLTPLGKATALLQRVSPSLVDVVLSRMQLKN